MNPELETVVTYTVYEYTHDGLVLTNQFFSMDDVNRFVDDYSSRSSTVYVFRTSCCDVFRPLNTSTNRLDTLAQVASTMTEPPFEFATPDEEEAAFRHQSVSFQNEAKLSLQFPRMRRYHHSELLKQLSPSCPIKDSPSASMVRVMCSSHPRDTNFMVRNILMRIGVSGTETPMAGFSASSSFLNLRRLVV